MAPRAMAEDEGARWREGPAVVLMEALAGGAEVVVCLNADSMQLFMCASRNASESGRALEGSSR